MKKFLLLVLSLFALESYSQKLVEGSLAPLKAAQKVELILDFSKAYIHGMSESEFSDYEKGWDKDKPQIVGLFMKETRDAIGDVIRLGRYSDADYIMRVYVIDISVSGDFECEVEVNDTSSTTIAKIDFKAKGGRFGTKLNLIKDGAQHAGTALGSFLKKKLR